MSWYELSSTDDPKLRELASRFSLHPLHVEDAESPDERIKVDQGSGYTFAVLKPVDMRAGSDGQNATLGFSTIDIFAGRKDGESFFITVSDPGCPASNEALARARREGADENPARLLYLILDTTVDLYFPAMDHYDDRLDELEDRVVAQPTPEVLGEIFALKRELVEFRRVLVGTRDATLHLQRDPNSIIDTEHQPFVRDIYDHIVRLLDTIETQRDLVNNSLDIYLSSVANRTNEVMKVLTVLSTIFLPALAITGLYGMNIKGLPFVDSPHGALIVVGITLLCTTVMLLMLRRRGYL